MRRLAWVCIPLLLAACAGNSTAGDAAPTTSTTSRPTTTTTPLASVDWSRVALPIDCGEGGTSTASGSVPVHPDEATEVVVVFATCVAGAGTPPTAALVYDSAASPTEPHLAQTLFEAGENWEPEPDATTADGARLTMPVYGYSSEEVPRCCPDLHPTLTWHWDGSGFVPVDIGPDHARLGDVTWF